MTLTREQLDELMRLVGLTRDQEIGCDHCLDLVASFAEQKLAGKTVPDSLQAVEQHMAVCSECTEEYEVLKVALGKLGNS